MRVAAGPNVREGEDCAENRIFYRDKWASGLLYLRVVRTVPRTRHYVSPGALTLCRPVLSFDYVREAYVLRGIGDRLGPVLREDRRRGRASKNGYKGPERRGAAGGSGRQHMSTSPPRVSDRDAQERSTASGQTRSGSGGQTPSGAGVQTRPGSGGQTPPGNGGQARPGSGGQTRPGSGGQTRPGSGGQSRAKANRGSRSKNARG
jgi:hypothetical protein